MPKLRGNVCSECDKRVSEPCTSVRAASKCRNNPLNNKKSPKKLKGSTPVDYRTNKNK